MSASFEIRQLQLEQASNYITYSMEALYLFECCITFSQEVEVIWKRQWSAMTWIYAFTRYDSVLFIMLNIIHIYVFTLIFSSCKAVVYTDYALQLIQFSCFASFSALRVYALLNGKKLIAGTVFLLNIVPLVANLYSYATSFIVLDGELCTLISPWSEELALRVSLATRIAVVVGDVLVLLVTWSKTAQSYYESRSLGIKAPLSALMFRDGTSYFVILLMINVLQVIERNNRTLFSLGLSSSLLAIVTPIIICRFTLNLRQVKPPGSSWVSGSQSFRLRFVGNAGGSLQFGAEEDNEREENIHEYISLVERPCVPFSCEEV